MTVRWLCDGCGAVFRGSAERELACPNCRLVGLPVADDLLDTDGAEDWRDDDERMWNDDDYASDQMLDDPDG
jgi:hypothetical protein